MSIGSVRRQLLGTLVGFALAFVAVPAVYAQSSDDPETVIVTYHVKPERQKALLDAVNQQWSMLRRLKLVEEARPHLLFRGTEKGGKPVLIEIFTWISGDAPDHVPAEVQTLWREMQTLVEARDGRAGIDVRQVTEVGEAKL